MPFPQPSTNPTRTRSSGRYRYERSPNTTSLPIPIPGARNYIYMPNILINGDTTPGQIHHGKDNVTDYTIWPDKRIAKDEERINANPAPAHWIESVGMRRPPGSELKEVVLKNVSVVPEYLPPCQNKRAINQYAWEKEMKRREESRVVSPDSGYDSVEEPEEGFYVRTQEGSENGVFED